MLEEDELRNPLNSDLETNYKHQSANRDGDYSRKTTFSRAFTFDGAALQRVVVQPLDTIQRTMTEIGNTIDPDAQYTNALIEQYTKHNEGHDGDLPMQTGFARKAKFWKVILLLSVVSGIMGLVAAGFMNAVEQVIRYLDFIISPIFYIQFIGLQIPKQYVTCDWGNDPDCGEWYSGEKYWILISGGAGLLIGLIRYATSYPDNLPGIFKDIQVFHVEPKWAPVTFIISLISLSGGATLGPEQALVTLLLL